jgi:hypothetical protein
VELLRPWLASYASTWSAFDLLGKCAHYLGHTTADMIDGVSMRSCTEKDHETGVKRMQETLAGSEQQY